MSILMAPGPQKIRLYKAHPYIQLNISKSTQLIDDEPSFHKKWQPVCLVLLYPTRLSKVQPSSLVPLCCPKCLTPNCKRPTLEIKWLLDVVFGRYIAQVCLKCCGWLFLFSSTPKHVLSHMIKHPLNLYN